MGIYTYITDHDIERWSTVDDKEVNELLYDARKIAPELLISTAELPLKRGWFKKPKTITLYTIHVSDGHFQARILNFPSDVSKSSINTYLTKSQTMIYLYGFLNAANRLKQQSNEKPTTTD